MIQLITTNRLRALEEEVERLRDEAAAAAGALDAAQLGEELATDAAIRFEGDVETLAARLSEAQAETDEQYEGLHAVIRQITAERDDARAAADAALGEAEAARAQVLLDAEDRVVLRALLRVARKKSALSRVFALFQKGELHSLHIAQEDAEAAAEAEGAAPNGWTQHRPGEALPPARDVQWRVQQLPVSGATAK
ncbi:hypothetical protein [Streptomyces sp. NPDC058495]|uniref:hypothetical protein n=1 Tax=unclassified Streptomyces TaxID=2593676 RepID=UPI0036633783